MAEEKKKGKVVQPPKGPPLDPDDVAEEAEKKADATRKRAKALKERYEE